MKITEHFSREEFDCKDGTRYPEGMIPMRLRSLCDVLEAIRADLHHPIRVVSGYRTRTYNNQIGGSRSSQHLEGRAADISVDEMSSTMLESRIRWLHDKGHIIIGGLGWYPTFVHVDIRPTGRLITWSGSRREN